MTEAERITRTLDGRWYGRYGLAFCPAHDNTHTPALSLTNGECGRLLAHCHAGCSFASILGALRSAGVVEGTRRVHWRSSAKPTRDAGSEQAMAMKREGQARRVWDEAIPIADTPAERYLREARGITCPLPTTLRFHAACWHRPTSKRHLAMVALVEGGDGFAIHRTYLRPDGSGKAQIEPAKAMLGAVAGGAVRLTDGPGGLVVAEGIETALSLACGLLRAPSAICAALSTSGLRALRLPPLPGRLTIAVDGDEPGRAAAHALAERAFALGWQVFLLPAPDGCDWNETLCKKGDAA